MEIMPTSEQNNKVESNRQQNFLPVSLLLEENSWTVWKGTVQ